MRRIFIIFLIGFSAIVLAFFILIVSSSSPPTEEIKNARIAISDARENNAHVYSSYNYSRAVSKYDSAMVRWKAENRKMILTRDYDEIMRLADEAADYANEAIEKATANSARLQKKLENLLDTVSGSLVFMDKNYSHLPLTNQVRSQINKAVLLYGEAKLAFEKDNLTLSDEKAKYAHVLISRSQKSIRDTLQNYFRDSHYWMRLNKKAIEYSRKNRCSTLVIDKYAHECYLYQNGKLINTYPVDLGKNWMGDKKQQGDKSTPEGEYKITKKLSGGQTKYYKALMINYPDEDDMKRFNQNKKNGEISKNAAIGGLIEIHGEGGKGVDWTDGCAALKNSDMDILYSYCQVGTRITIIGSLKTLNELYSE